jgi:hypothetical protein
MARLGSVGREEVRAIVGEVKAAVGGWGTLEEAAQVLADLFFGRFAESTVLVRVFATVPFAELPEANRRFVLDLTEAKGVSALLEDTTIVLSLMGTHGVLAEWNSRHSSRGHVGIPLFSPAFVDEIPMIARLLKELGVSVEGLGAARSSIITRTLGSLNGIFYVADARTAEDEQGRRIIAAQDFVERHGVATVFGFGGAFLRERSFAAMVVFARETVPRETAEQLSPLASALKTATMQLVDEGRLFRPARR